MSDASNRLVIVPESLRQAIDAKLDAALEQCPDAAPEREQLYKQLLTYFDAHGVVPDFTVEKASA